jgi:hypothetical protein
VRSLKTREAAGLLNVSPNTLRTWERKFGCPTPVRSPGGHRAYAYAEITALRDALKRGLSVESAVSAVREGLGAGFETLVDAIDAFSGEGADRAMEASLALRSIERSVDEVLLPGLAEVRSRHGLGSAQWAVAHRWSLDWLTRAQRLAPPTDARPGILIGDATAADLDSPVGPSVRALELLCRRGGVAVLTLPVEALRGLPDALTTIDPLCVVVAGGQSSDEQVGRWAYSVRQVVGALPTALYLRTARSGGPKLSAHVLSGVPIEAQRQLFGLIEKRRSAKAAALSREANRSAQLR